MKWGLKQEEILLKQNSVDNSKMIVAEAWDFNLQCKMLTKILIFINWLTSLIEFLKIQILTTLPNLMS